MNIYEVIAECLEQGKNGMLATVIMRDGSAPGDVGTKMFILKENETNPDSEVLLKAAD